MADACRHPSTTFSTTRWECHTCGAVAERATLPARLEALAAQLRESNPTLTLVADDWNVWLRHSDGRDYAIYSATIDYRIVCVYDWATRVTAVSRQTPVADTLHPRASHKE